MPNGQTTIEGQMFADRLRETIAARNETQASVAAGINVSPQAVGKWVAGGRIDDENLKSLSDYLGVNWLWLRYGEEAIEALGQWVLDREPKCEPNVVRCDYDALLEKIGVGVWQVDLLSGKVELCGPCVAFFTPLPTNLPELRLAIADHYVPAFDAFVTRVARSTHNEPAVAIEVKTKCSEQGVSIWGRNTGEKDTLKIGGLMLTTTAGGRQVL